MDQRLVTSVNQLSHAIISCRTLDWIILDLSPLDEATSRDLSKLREAWRKAVEDCVTTAANEPFAGLIRGWMDPRLSDAALEELPSREGMKAEYLLLISRPLEAACSEMRELQSPYSRYLFQIDFLLHAIGLVPSRVQSWGSYMKETLPGIAASTVPILAAIFNPLAAVTLSVLRAGSAAQQIATTTPPPKPEIKGCLVFFDLIKRLYSRRLREMPPAIINRVADIDRTIESMIRDEDVPAWIAYLKRRQGIFLGGGCFLDASRSKPRKSLYDDRDQAMERRVADFLHDYPDILAFDILVTLIRENSVSNSPRRVQVHFHGPPGTGKTRCANRLAAALGLPIVHVRISTCNDFELLCALPGSHQAADFVMSSREFSDKRIMTIIPYAMAKAGIQNPIIFIDEAASLLSGSLGSQIAASSILDVLKILFDENERTIAAPAVAQDAGFDYSRLTIILATTRSFAESDVDPALANRFWSIPFAPLEETTKERALKEALDSLASGRLTRSKNAEARGECLRFISYIASLSTQRGYTGFRPLQRALWSAHSLCVNEIARIPPNRPPNWDTFVKECIELALPPMESALALDN